MISYYKKVNTAIISGIDVASDVSKDKKFYEYLLNNRVAYYYCSQLSKIPNDIELDIIKHGDMRNQVFYKTLEFMDVLCKEHGIEYLLYKTYKYFGEVIGGDIDIIVHADDFQKFLSVFSSVGWDCVEDEPGKGKCTMDGYITIEPHITISWNGNNLIEPGILWENTIVHDINKKSYLSVDYRYEVISIFMKIIYGPEYLDLYDKKILDNHKGDISTILPKTRNPIQTTIIKKIIRTEPKWMFPTFQSSMLILLVNLYHWFDTGYFNKMMFIHNIFWKYRYLYNRRLPFLTSYYTIND